MNRLRQWFAGNPFFLGAIVGATALLFTISASIVYATKIQPAPQVIRRAEPITNADRDAAGLSFGQWQTAGALGLWVPIEKRVFRQGETMFTLRNDCFVNKTIDGKVVRAFLSGDRRLKNGDLDTAQQTGTQVILPALDIPTRTDGCAAKNHPTRIPYDLSPGVWTYAAAVDFYQNTIKTSVRVWFRPVVIEVVSDPTAARCVKERG